VDTNTKAPSQRMQVPRNYNQNGGDIALTPFLFLEMMMLSWCPSQTLGLGTKKLQGRLLSTRASTRSRGASTGHQETTIKMGVILHSIHFSFLR